eukprot:TRINITY_DN425_c0_g1_i1.p1 TRINITY_DN425_c0_g1~~TRINITY_DN425_c0_g1_i1.p1  ORF type:complete len:535 (+),score=43.90 TRINITY_DN425_c0_g1_i1:134-1738(+)
MITNVIILALLFYAKASLDAKGFIRAKGTKFVDANCQQYVVNGWNGWEIIESVLGLVRYVNQSIYGDKTPYEWMLDKSVEVKMNTFRMFGHGHTPERMALQISPGNYNEDALASLDKVLAEAAKRNIRIVISFTDNWKEADSKINYLQWAGKTGIPDAFFSDASVKQLLKNHMKFITSRTNTVNGRVYRDDPTILAWNLINELRTDFKPICDFNCEQVIQNWISEMASYLKSLDPNHMVTPGHSGMFGKNSSNAWANPDAWRGWPQTWAYNTGQNFVPDHSSPAIDFAGFHIWIDNWGIKQDPQTFFKQWIQAHIDDARKMNKPVIIEEFGKKVEIEDSITSSRDPFFSIAYQQTISSVQADDALQGVMWWEWEENEGKPLRVSDVKTYHTTWTDVIVPKSQTLSQLAEAKPVVSDCVPGDVTSFDALYVNQGSGQSVVYIYRPYLVASNEGETIGTSEGVSREQCASNCEARQPECQSFAYNEWQQSCFLKTSNSPSNGGFVWNEDGWSTYWRQANNNGNNAQRSIFIQTLRN